MLVVVSSSFAQDNSENQAGALAIITFEEALNIASVNSPDLKQSLLNVERTKQTLFAKRASMKSQFLLTLNPLAYSQSRSFDDFNNVWNTSESFSSNGTFSVVQSIPWTDGTISLNNKFGWQDNYSEYSGANSQSYSNTTNITLNQPLFTYNTNKVEVRQVELDNENAMLSYAMVLLNVEKQVAQYFYTIFTAQMSLDIKKDEMDNSRTNYDIIKQKTDAGLVALEELYQAELNLATAESAYENQKVSMENSKDQFKQYLGMDLKKDLSVVDQIDVEQVEVDLDNAISNGIKSRMEIRQREIDIENSQFDLLAVKASNEFKGSLGLSIGITGQDKDLSNIYENPTMSPSVGLSFNVPIFDWGERKARIKAQEAVMQSNTIDLEQEIISIELNIRDTYRSLNNLINQIKITAQSEKNAERTYQINLEKYRNGDLTGMDLSLFQTQLSEAKMNSVQAKIDYQLELLNLKIQSMYDFETKEAVIAEELMKNY